MRGPPQLGGQCLLASLPVSEAVAASRLEPAQAPLSAEGSDSADHDTPWGPSLGARPPADDGEVPGIATLRVDRACLLYTSDAADDTPCVDL
eukprot:5098664-Pyramimonas_sp.AAC.1